jgi:hypothetical protein
MTTPDTPLRRLTLCLVEKQPILEEEINTDFLDFCLLHMRLIQEPPGVQALCMKLAYRMCSFYPELMHEFQVNLSIIQPELLKPGVKHLIKKSSLIELCKMFRNRHIYRLSYNMLFKGLFHNMMYVLHMK